MAVKQVFRVKTAKTRLRQDALKAIFSNSETFPIYLILTIFSATEVFTGTMVYNLKRMLNVLGGKQLQMALTS